MDKNMKKTTYCAPGLMELRLRLGPPSAPVEIEFTGGTSSGYGSVAASFSTDDPVLQSLIERSDEFRTGKIRLRP